MHGPLPPDVTLDAPHWWLPGMPLLPPAGYMAPVPLKRKRDMSAEAKRDPAKQAYMRVPDEAKLWFVDFRVYHARVHGKTLAYNIRRAKQLVPELFGPETFRRWHDSGALDLAADRPWSCHRSPFCVLRTSLMPSRPGSVSASTLGNTSTVICCASSTPNSIPRGNGRGSSYAACSYHGSSRRLTPATGRVRLTLPENANSLRNLAGSHMEPGRDSCAHGSIRRARVDQKSRVSPCLRLARLRQVRLAANMRGGTWTQIVHEWNTDRVHPHGPLFPRQLRTGSQRTLSWT